MRRPDTEAFAKPLALHTLAIALLSNYPPQS